MLQAGFVEWEEFYLRSLLEIVRVVSILSFTVPDKSDTRPVLNKLSQVCL